MVGWYFMSVKHWYIRTTAWLMIGVNLVSAIGPSKSVMQKMDSQGNGIPGDLSSGAHPSTLHLQNLIPSPEQKKTHLQQLLLKLSLNPLYLLHTNPNPLLRPPPQQHPLIRVLAMVNRTQMVMDLRINSRYYTLRLNSRSMVLYTTTESKITSNSRRRS